METLIAIAKCVANVGEFLGVGVIWILEIVSRKEYYCLEVQEPV